MQLDQETQIAHYENFPVASILLPKALRKPVAVIYHIARIADDLADEGEVSAAQRHAQLAAFQQGLDAIAQGQAAPTHTELFQRLAQVVQTHQLPLQPFYDLVSAFQQDVDVKRYADWPTLQDYCRRSANPVGHLMLHLFQADEPNNIQDSDAICTALQLINFWQDVSIDWQKKRIYLPEQDMQRFQVTEQHLEQGLNDHAWQALLNYEVDFAEQLMLQGAPLALRISGRFGLELCAVVQGGLRILEKIRKNQFDVFQKRPVLKKADWWIIAFRVFKMKLTQRVAK